MNNIQNVFFLVYKFTILYKRPLQFMLTIFTLRRSMHIFIVQLFNYCYFPIPTIITDN